MQNKFDFLETEKGIFLRFGYWKSKRTQHKGTICLLGGRAEFMEKYIEVINKLNGLGLDVFSFDWRGQGLSTRLINNPRKGYIKSYDDYIKDLVFFVEHVFLKNANLPFIIMGHSMGGQIILRYLQTHENIFDKAVLLSPMIRIRTVPIPEKLLKIVARILVTAGYERVYMAGNNNSTIKQLKKNPLTSDRRRYETILEIIAKNPDLAIGGVTAQWLLASFESTDILHQPGYVEKIFTPILIFSAENDRVVCNNSQRLLCQRLPRCKLYMVYESQHEILQEKDHIQKQFWDVFRKLIA